MALRFCYIVMLSGTKCSRNIPDALGALALHKASPIGEAVNGKEPLTEEDKKTVDMKTTILILSRQLR